MVSALDSGQSRTQSPQAPWSAVWSPGETLGKWNAVNHVADLSGNKCDISERSTGHAPGS